MKLSGNYSTIVTEGSNTCLNISPSSSLLSFFFEIQEILKWNRFLIEICVEVRGKDWKNKIDVCEGEDTRVID